MGKKYKKNKSNRKTRRRRTKRVYKRRASFRKRKVKRKTRRRRRSPKRRRKRLQKGGVQLGKCNNPFQGNAVVNGVRVGNYHPYEPISRPPYGLLTRQGRGMKGGGSMWRDLGLSVPKDMYNDAMDFFGNVKNTYMGNRKGSTSNVMNQPIRNTHAHKSNGSSLKQSDSTGSSSSVTADYNTHFTAADTETAQKVSSALSTSSGD